MTRATKLRPWQFSLRFLLAVTALVAVGAAFFGWRERQLAPQRRAVARIVELGGSVEIERRGWPEAVWRGDTEEVVAVTLPGHLVDQGLRDLKELPALRRITMAYSRAREERPAASLWTLKYEPPNRQLGATSIEVARLIRVTRQIPFAEVTVSLDGVVFPIDVVFDNCEYFVFR